MDFSGVWAQLSIYLLTLTHRRRLLGSPPLSIKPAPQIITRVFTLFMRLAEVVEKLWEELPPFLSLVRVITTASSPLSTNELRKIIFNVSGDILSCSGCRSSPTIVRVAICVEMVQHFNVSRTCIVSRLQTAIREHSFPDMSEFEEHIVRLMFYTNRMSGTMTLEENGVENGDEILVLQELSGGKPVIYLFPPSPIANEAHTNPRPPISPPNTPSSELAAFDPSRLIILPSNSALLPFDKVTGYIDDALLANVPEEEWSRIVGVDRSKATNASLFWVLEWGGTETK
ncbi:hypothetical protein B0J17DRAFT_722028 [Rhizoctonia solani]|nr:hypothetical protein B0J17DRAFT_722028 [Rhizoctonia solani]